MKIILIATGHKIQCGTSSPRDSDRLCELAERIVLEAGCSLVAEEMSEDARDAEFGVGSTVPEKVAKKLGVKHLFCDPDSSERQSLGVKSRNEILLEAFFSDGDTDDDVEIEEMVRASYRIRESSWLKKLKEANEDGVLFILGANHLQSFSEMLRLSGIEVSAVYEVLEESAE